MPRFICVVFALALSSATLAQDWREIKPPPTRQDVSETYERIATLDPLDDATQWKGADHGQSAQASVCVNEGRVRGTKGLRVIYTFTGRPGLEYVDVAGNIPIPDDATAVGLWMKGGAQPLPARLRVLDAHGECFQYNLRDLKPGLWVLGVASLDNPGVHWGGDNNGKLERPCRVASFVFDKIVNSPTAQGECAIAEFGSYRIVPERLQPHGFKLWVPPNRKLLVYEPDEPIQIRLAIDKTDPAQRPPDVPVLLQVADPFGATVWSVQIMMDETHEDEFRTSLYSGVQLALDEPGAYDMRVRVKGREDDLDAPWADFRFAVLRPPPAQDESSPWGVCTHFGQSWSRDVMPMIARAGIRFYRDEIYWGAVEPERGKLAVPDRFREYLAEGQRLGLEPLIILDYANKLYDEGNFPLTPETRAAFARYATTVATELPAIRFFEIWNEWCGGCGMGGRKGTAADYAPLYLAAAQAVRATNAQATVVGIGGEWDGKDFDAMMAGGSGPNIERAGAQMDAFSIHPYMHPGLPGDNFAKHLQKAQEQAAAASHRGGIRWENGVGTTEPSKAVAAMAKPLPQWITEIGWPTELDGRGSDWLHQARCLVRALVLARANGVERVCWYDFKDDGLKLECNENNFGLVHHDQFGLAPKPAYVAYAHLIRTLAGREFQETDPTAYLYGAIFIGERDAVWVVWAKTEGQRVATTFKVPSGSHAEDMFGRRLRIGREIRVAQDPVFVYMPLPKQR